MHCNCDLMVILGLGPPSCKSNVEGTCTTVWLGGKYGYLRGCLKEQFAYATNAFINAIK